MEAAINNAGVVYHSDPRLILAYLAVGQAGGSLFVTCCPRSFHLPSWSCAIRRLAKWALKTAAFTEAPLCIVRYIYASSYPRYPLSFRNADGRRGNEAYRTVEKKKVHVSGQGKELRKEERRERREKINRNRGSDDWKSSWFARFRARVASGKWPSGLRKWKWLLLNPTRKRVTLHDTPFRPKR